MAGQGATAENIAAIIAQVTLAMSQERDEEEDNKSIYMVHQAELENDKCYSDEEEYDEGLYMVHQAEFENGKCSSYEEEYEKSIHLADLWKKSEREIGVKFDIQKGATNEFFQQTKDDTLTNFDTEHVSHNLVFTVSQKSKSYLEAAKGKFSDTNNNQTFPIRSTLEQGVAVNEGLPTAESPVTNEDVLTN